MQQYQPWLRSNHSNSSEATEAAQKNFEIIYREYEEKIFRYALSITQSHEEAEDVIQEVFLKVWIKHSYLTGIENIKDYLYAMARNYILNSYRKKQRIRSALAVRSNGAEGHCLNDGLIVKEMQQVYRQALNRLPEKQKLVFMLRENDYRHKQIAKALHVSTNTVKNHLDIASKSVRTFVVQSLGITIPEAKKNRLLHLAA